LVLCFVFDAFDSDPDFDDFEEGSGLFGSDGDEDAFEVGIIVGLKEGMDVGVEVGESEPGRTRERSFSNGLAPIDELAAVARDKLTCT
jgi:hypothetical protein